MIKFTDPRLYVQGVGTAIMTDPATGDIVFFSDKFQDGNITVSADDGLVSAGIGNAPAIMIPTNPNVQVSVTAADYSEYAKAAAVGGSISAGAPVMVCQTVNATGSSISIDVTSGAPVAGPGMDNVVCYVQEIGAESKIATDGTAYELNPTSGAITGFTATNGKQYLVTYYASQANATMTTITTNVKGKVVMFTLQRPIYTNVDAKTNQGDLWGMLYEIVPRLQLMPDGAANNGNQNSPTTTAITGRGISYDADTIVADCGSCALNGAPLMYRVIVPCDKNAGIDGILGILGGTVSLAADGTYQLAPAVIVNGKLSYGVPASDFAYVSASDAVATVGANTGLVTAAGEGDTQISISYTVGSTTYSDIIDVSVAGT